MTSSTFLKHIRLLALLAALGVASAYSCTTGVPTGDPSKQLDPVAPAELEEAQLSAEQAASPGGSPVACATVAILGDLTASSDSTHVYTAQVFGDCGEATHNWSVSGNCSIDGGISASTVSVLFAAIGSCTVTDTVACGNCPDAPVAGSLQVGIDGMVDCTIAAALPCSNSTGNIACVPDTGPANYTWTITNGTITAGQGTRCITYTAGASGVVRFTIVGNDECHCEGELEVPIKPTPTCEITAVAVCPNSLGNTACVPDAGAGATYAWTITNGTITSGQGTRCITYTAGANGAVGFSVVVTRNGCIARCELSVPFLPTLDCNVTAEPPCPNSTGNIACVGEDSAGTTYAWTITGGTITGGQGTRCITYTAGPSGTVRFSVDVVMDICDCPCTGTLEVPINPAPLCTITASAPCPNSTGNTASVPDAGAGATYAWTISGGTITAGQGTRSITYTAGASGIVALTVQVINSAGCECEAELTLAILAAPACTITGEAPCPNITGNTASVADAGAGATYVWTISGGTITAGQGTPTIIYTSGASGSVNLTVDVTAANSCACRGTLSLPIGVNPDCTITAGAPCPSSTGNTASVPDAGAGATYEWTISGGTITAGQGTRTITYTAGASGVVVLSVHVTNADGCECRATRELPISAVLDCTITAESPCPNSTGNTASVPDAGVGATYAWTISGGTITAGQGTRRITYTAGASGTVSLGVSINRSGCSCEGSLQVPIDAAPVCTITGAAPCPNSTGNTASVADAGAGATYAWTISGGTITAGQGTRTITYTAGASGSVSLAVDVTNAAGCSCRGTLVLTIGVAPNCTISANVPCPSSTGNTASVANAGAGATYAWTISNGTITAGQGTPTITYTAGASGTISLTVNVTAANGCSCRGTLQGAINPALSCVISTPSQGGVFTGTISGGTAPYACAAGFSVSGWVVDSCVVDNGGNGPGFTVTYHRTDGACSPIAPPIVDVAIADSRGCETECSQSVPCPPGGCVITGGGVICEGETTELCVEPATGTLPPVTISWTGPDGFTANTDCVTVDTPGVYTATVTDGNGMTSVCCAPVLLVKIKGSAGPCANSTGLAFAAHYDLSGQGTFAGSYSWSISGNGTFCDGTTSATGNPVCVNAGAPGSFTLNATITGLVTFTCDGTATAEPVSGTCSLTVPVVTCP